MKGTVQGHQPGIKTNPEPDARGGRRLSLWLRTKAGGQMAIPENSGTLLSWEEVLEGKHSSVHTQTSLDQHYIPGTTLCGQDSQHTPVIFWEPSPSGLPGKERSPIANLTKGGGKGKAGATLMPLQLFTLLGNMRKQE